MTDYRALCAELADSVELLLDLRKALHQGQREFKRLAITEGCLERARVALAEPPTPPAEMSEGLPVPEAPRYEFSVYDADYVEQAGGSAPTYAQVFSEGQRYLAQYQQDGPHTVELRRVEVLHPGPLPLPKGQSNQGENNV